MAATVLVIDDDVLTRTAVASVLEDLGHTVMTAGDGREAMALFAAEPAQLVVTDIFMPVMDGIEVIIALREQIRIPKVIAMSGGGRQCGMDVLHMAMLLGADAALHKPIVPARLSRVATDLLAQADGEALSAQRSPRLRAAA